MPAAQPHAFQVDGHDAVPHVLRRLARATVLGRKYAGVVVEDVEASERLDRESDHRLHLRRLRHIGGHERGLAALGPDGVDGGPPCVLHRVGHDDFGALRREQLGAHPAEAASRARDQRYLPVEAAGATHNGAALLRCASVVAHVARASGFRVAFELMRRAAYRARVSERAGGGTTPRMTMASATGGSAHAAGSPVDERERIEKAAQPWVEPLARLGLAARGLVYAVVGVLAVRIAMAKPEEADRRGALEAVGRQPFGKVLLVVMAVGFAGYALWRFLQALLDTESDGTDAKGLAKRAGYLARAVLYSAFFVSTVRFLMGSGAPSGGAQQQQDWTGRLLGPWRAVLVGQFLVVGLSRYPAAAGGAAAAYFFFSVGLGRLPDRSRRHGSLRVRRLLVRGGPLRAGARRLALHRFVRAWASTSGLTTLVGVPAA